MRNAILLIAIALTGCLATPASAQCSDPWVTKAFQLARMVPTGSGNSGECNINRFAGGHWPDENTINTLVRVSRLCSDPWIPQVYVTVIGRYPQGSGVAGDCNPSVYGSWSSYPQLTSLIQAYVRRIIPTHTTIVQPINAATEHLADNMGGCLGVENGTTYQGQGSRIIHWPCQSIPDQQFRFMGGQVFAFGMQQFRLPSSSIPDSLCVDAQGGAYLNAQVIVWPCRMSSSRWTMTPSGEIMQNNLCISLRTGAFVGNTDATLQRCGNRANQIFRQE